MKKSFKIVVIIKLAFQKKSKCEWGDLVSKPLMLAGLSFSFFENLRLSATVFSVRYFCVNRGQGDSDVGIKSV